MSEPKKYDLTLKRLVMEVPQDFVSWLLPGAQFVRELSPHLPKNRKLDADILLLVLLGDQQCLLHIEFQAYGETDMDKRLWEYNVMATHKFDLPVYSVVIYLQKGGTFAGPPYEWVLPDGRPVHHFSYAVVKLWEIPTDEWLQSGLSLKGLLPLAPLTREGHHFDVVDVVVEGLLSAGAGPYTELFDIAFLLTTFVFKSEEEQARVQRRFQMASDFLRETWGYQYILNEGLQEGRQKGLQEGFQQALHEELQRHTHMLFSFVNTRFPTLKSLAEEQAAKITEPALFQKLIIRVGMAKDEQEAKSHLLDPTHLLDEASEEMHE